MIRLRVTTAAILLLSLPLAAMGVVTADNMRPALSQLHFSPRMLVHEMPPAVQLALAKPLTDPTPSPSKKSCSPKEVTSAEFVAASASQQPTEQPYVKLPEKVTGKAGRFITIKAETNGENVWWYSPDAEVNLFPSELLKDSKTAVVIVEKNGTYRVCAYTALNGKSHPITICSVVVGDVPPGPGPGPGPDPKPDPKPDPVNPAPIPLAGLRVLIVYESTEKVKYPLGQLAILDYQPMRDFLNSNCVTGANGVKEWRIWDKDVATDFVPQHWKDVMKRPRTQIPWIVVSNGVSGFEGPLPATVEETTKLISKYAK